MVAGGAGVAGEAIVAALLRRGAVVAVPSRTPDRLERLRAGIPGEDRGRLHTVGGDIGSAEGVFAVRTAVRDAVGPLHGVVAALGAWWEGETLIELQPATWDRILRNNLTSHFLVARAFLPDLSTTPDSVYVALAGIAAIKPVAHSGPISATGAAQRMLSRTLAVELAESHVRVHEVGVLTPIVTRLWDERRPIDRTWLTGEQVGGYVADVVSPEFAKKSDVLLEIGGEPHSA